MDQYIKKRRITTASSENTNEPKSRITDVIKQQFKDLVSSVRDLTGRFRVIQELVKKIGMSEESQKNSIVLANTSMQFSQIEDGVFNGQARQADSRVQQLEQLAIAQRMAVERVTSSVGRKQDDVALKKLQQSSQGTARTKKIKKRF